jgi:DNA-binding NarL/FixJ family response regulator
LTATFRLNLSWDYEKGEHTHRCRVDGLEQDAGAQPGGIYREVRVGSSDFGRKLTPREQEVLGLIVEGKTNKQIAAELLLSEATIKATIVRLCQKLGLHNRVSLAVAAVRLGLLDEAQSPP